MKLSDYGREGERIFWRRQIFEADLTVQLVAEDVREERTGVHARVKILGNSAVLAYSTFNVDRDEDRVRLANSAYKHLERLKTIYPQTHLKNDLDQFCLNLWDVKLLEFAPEMLAGTLHPAPPDLILDPYIIRGGGVIVFAPPGRGKSYTLYTMQVCVDAGVQTFWPVKRARTLLINLERSKLTVADRLGNLNRALGLPRDRQLPTLNARGRSLLSISRTAEEYIRKHDVEVVFVDSISRAGGGDLSNNEDANRVVDTLNRIAPTWVGLAHTPRADETHLYGSVHFEAGADVVVQLVSEQQGAGPLGVGLQITKANDLSKQPMWVGAFEFDANGLSTVRRARSNEFPDVQAMRRLSPLEAIREHLLDIGPADASQVADDLGMPRSTVSRILNTHPSTFAKGDKIGRNQRFLVLR